MSDVGFFVNKESSNECANEEHQMSSDIDTTARQNGLLFNGCADSIVKTVRLMDLIDTNWLYICTLLCVIHACNMSANNDLSE
jgi:hypothetical protein